MSQDALNIEQRIACRIIAGFSQYREAFQRITLKAQHRFELAQWHQAQEASAMRIQLYEQKVMSVSSALLEELGAECLTDPQIWPQVKAAYLAFLDARFDDELAETWYNSVFFRLVSHDQIHDRAMFLHSTRSLKAQLHASELRRYQPQGDIRQTLKAILTDYAFKVPYQDIALDVDKLEAQLRAQLPDWVCKDPELSLELYRHVFYRNKGAYWVGRIYTCDEQWPLAIALIHPDGEGIVADSLITDEAEVSIIFSFTRSYFMVEVEVPAALISFLKQILPAKQIAELYTSIGFYKHGKSEFYRSLMRHLQSTDDQFVMAAGVRGMVMSVFTLPGFNTVFKIIKDTFAHAKNITRQTVIEKYRLVKTIDRVGRLADTQEFADFKFPKAKFSAECLAELLEVAPSTVSVEGDTVLIKHCWTERRMIPLNLYLETATDAQIEEALDDYGMAIKQLAAANIFPGDMLLKNFGVTRHGRVVFYDYDEICFLTEVNFRRIPPPRYPEDEMASEPWYSIGPNDVFPEEFPVFLFSDRKLRKRFSTMHGELYKAEYWQSLQQAIASGTVIDVFPYRRVPVVKV